MDNERNFHQETEPIAGPDFQKNLANTAIANTDIHTENSPEQNQDNEKNPYANLSDEELSKIERKYTESLNEIRDGTMRGLEDHLNEPMYHNELNKIYTEKERRSKSHAETEH